MMSRQGWLGVLSATSAELRSARWQALLSEAPQLRVDACLAVRDAEVGLVMVRGRIGGDGAPFALGEATVTRCVVERPGPAALSESATVTGWLGVGYLLGSDREAARILACLDAALQDPAAHDEVMRIVVSPLVAEENRRRQNRGAAVDRTRVDFATMVRGDG